LLFAVKLIKLLLRSFLFLFVLSWHLFWEGGGGGGTGVVDFPPWAVYYVLDIVEYFGLFEDGSFVTSYDTVYWLYWSLHIHLCTYYTSESCFSYYIWYPRSYDYTVHPCSFWVTSSHMMVVHSFTLFHILWHDLLVHLLLYLVVLDSFFHILHYLLMDNRHCTWVPQVSIISTLFHCFNFFYTNWMNFFNAKAFSMSTSTKSRTIGKGVSIMAASSKGGKLPI